MVLSQKHPTLKLYKFYKKLFKKVLFSLRTRRRTKYNGEWILLLNMKDIFANTYSIDQLFCTTTQDTLKPSIWEITKMERQLLHLIFSLPKSDKLWVDLKDKKDFRFFNRKLKSLDYQKKTIGGIWIWESSVLFLTEVLDLVLRD